MFNSVPDIVWNEAPVVILRLNTAGTVIDCNPYARQLTGNDLTGLALDKIFVDFQMRPATLDVGTLMGANNLSRFHLPTAMGLPINLLFRFVAAPADEVLAIGWHDMPEMTRLQQQLIDLNSELSHFTRAAFKDYRFEMDRKEEDHRRILEAAGEGIFGLDAEGRHTVVNPAAASMLGYSQAELIGKSGHELWHSHYPDGRPYPEAESPIHQTLAQGVAYTNDSDYFQRRDGSFFPVTFTSRPIIDHRRVVGAVVTFVDISERKRIENALAASEERYHHIFVNSPQPMWLFDETTLRFLDVNDAAIAHYGYSAEEFRAMTLKDIRPPEEVALLQQTLAATPEESVAGEFRHQKKNGEIIDVALWSTRTFIAGQAGRIVLINDITERKQAEGEIKRVNADLQRFAEVTAHHMQEPARRMATYAERLTEQWGNRIDDAESRLSLEFIDTQARRLHNLLRDVELYLSADRPRGEIKATDANKVVSALLARMTDSISGARAEISLGDLPPARIDVLRLRDLFELVLENALQHGRSDQSLHITIDGKQNGKHVRYGISDNGPGIEKEYRERVFRVFEHLASGSEGTGTGIGLAIVRRIAESCGGRAWIEEAPSGGCCVLFELPVAEPA